MQTLFMELNNLKTGFLGDLTGGVSSARISLSKADKVSIVVSVASAAADLNVTLKQSDAVTAGNTKDVVRKGSYYKKVGAATSFTKVEPLSTPVANVVDADANGAAGIFVFEVRGEDLDQENGYSYVSLDVTLGAVARIGSIVLVQGDCREIPAYTIAV